MELTVGKEYRVDGYAYQLKLLSLRMVNGQQWASLSVSAMILHVTTDLIIGEYHATDADRQEA